MLRQHFDKLSVTNHYNKYASTILRQAQYDSYSVRRLFPFQREIRMRI